MKHLKLFFACLLMTVLSIGQVWAAENDTHDFAQELSQLLNNNATISSINIAEQSYPVKEVIVSYRYNKTIENAVTMEVSVGGTSWGTQYSEGTGSNYSTKSFTHDAATGAIVISFTNNTGSGTGHGTFYVNNIQLVEGASSGGQGGDDPEPGSGDDPEPGSGEGETAGTGFINFGSGEGKTSVNSSSVSGNDSRGKTWTITTEGTTSFTPSNSQIGSSSKPATSITFTTTLSESKTISAFEAEFGGFSGTAGTVTLKVDDTTVGSGSLNGTSDVTVGGNLSTAQTGTVLTVTVTNISKGVKVYSISYTVSGTTQTTVLPVQFTPNGGVITGTSLSVELSQAEETEDVIYYTFDANAAENGSTESPWVEYSQALSIEETKTIYAAAKNSNDEWSAVTNTTIIKPLTVAEALNVITAGTNTTGRYAKGIVSEIVTEYNAQYHNISYNISDDGQTTSDQLQAYRGKSYNGANFTSADDIQVGDVVVVYGNLIKYGNNPPYTYEFAENNQLYYLFRKTLSSISVKTPPTKTEYYMSDTFEPAGLVLTLTYNTGTEDVTYTTENADDFTFANNKEWAATGNTNVTIGYGGMTTTQEITVVADPIIQYTVSWSANGGVVSTDQVQHGQKVTDLPENPATCHENVAFKGWIDEEVADSESEPQGLFLSADDAPVVTKAVTYYAVYADIVAGGPTTTNIAYSGSTTGNMTGNNDAVTLVQATNKTGWIVTGDKGGGSNYPGLNKDGTIRLYYNASGNSSITVTAPMTITSVVVTCKANNDNIVVKVGNNTIAVSEGVYPINATSFTIINGYSESNQVHIQNIAVNYTAPTTYTHYSTTCMPPLNAPTMTEDGVSCGSVEVTLSQSGNPKGTKIYYTLDGTTPTAESNEYSAAFTLTETKTVTAIAIKGSKASEPVSAEYTVLPEYENNLAGLKAVATETAQEACVTFSNLLVTAVKGSTAYMQDASGNAYMIYKYGHEFVAGDKLSATNAKLSYKSYFGQLEFTSIEGISKASEENTVTPTTRTIASLTDADYGKLVKLENVTYNSTDNVFAQTIEEITSQVTPYTAVMTELPTTWKNGGLYDVTGIVTYVTVEDVTTIQISPRAEGDVVSKAEALDAPTSLSSSNVTAASATLSWGIVTNAESYTLSYRIGEGEATLVANITTNSYELTNLNSGVTYTWTVKAVGNDLTTSDSEYATSATFTTTAPATLTWIVNGDTENAFATTNANAGKVVLPTTNPLSPCSELYPYFVGWTATPITGSTQNSPTLVNEETAASEATTYYAVFAAGTEGTKYELVTDMSNVHEGDQVMIASGTSGSIYVLGSQSNNNRGVASVTVANNAFTPEIATATNDEKCFNLILGTAQKEEEEDTYYTFYDAVNIGYLYAASSSSNWLRTQTTNTDNGKWSIEIDATSKVATITAQGTNSRNLLKYNSNSSCFSCYGSGQDDVYLYKKEADNYTTWITTCPVTYTITLAGNPAGTVEGGTISATKTTSVEANEEIELTATPADGYTTGAWVITDAYDNVVEGVMAGNVLTMPAYDVTVNYTFTAKKDYFVDGLHGNEQIERSAAYDELPSLENVAAGTGCNAYNTFVGWTAADAIYSDAPAEAQPEVLSGSQIANGRTFIAVWSNGIKYITHCCTTGTPENLAEPTVTASSAKLTWDAVTDATKYKVTVSDGDSYNEEFEVEGATYTVTGLTASTEYLWTVQAYAGCWGAVADDADGFTTAAEAQSYAITIVADNGQVVVEPELTEGEITEGEIVMMTATPNEGYLFREWQFSGVTTYDADANEVMFTMPANAVTVTAVFYAIPTVTWTVDGEVIATTQATNGKVGTLQEVEDHWQYSRRYQAFMGWTASTTASGATYVTEETPVYGDITLNAVFGQCDVIRQIFNSTTMQSSVSGYTGTFENTCDNLTWTINNFNNNNRGWEFIKAGRKDYTSLATIATKDVIADPVTMVKVKVDAVTANKINSTKLYVATNAEYTENLQTIALAVAKGEMVYTIPTPTANCYYKLEYDCASGSSNGLITISKVEYYMQPDADQTVIICPEVDVTNVTELTAENVDNKTNVHVGAGESVTVKEDVEVNSLILEDNAVVTLEGDIDATEFGISNSGDNSGQVIIGEANNLHLSGAAYFDFTLEPGAEHAKYGYYAFCVPFPVNSNSGITTPSHDELQDGVDYVLYYYDGAVRATGAYGWKRFHGTLNPGVFYMISLYADENGDCQYNTIRFKMEARPEGYDCKGTSATISYQQYASANNNNAGWNGVGNPTLQNVKTTADAGAYMSVMQVYDRENNVFTDAYAGSDVFKIGIPFFIQSNQDGNLAFSAETTPSSIAPRRISGREMGRVRVNFGNETYTDHLYVSASEDALNSYELCKDMAKMSMGTAKVAQISSRNYGVNLLVEHAPLVNDQATYQLNLYAPAAGTYSISAQQVEGATLYVTYNGAIVWNLSLGDYELDLTRGTTTGYGLLLVVQPNQMPTGVENGESLNGENGVQKILLNGQLYILRDGHLYDAVGKEMK